MKSPLLKIVVAFFAFFTLISFEPKYKVRNVTKRPDTVNKKKFKLTTSESDFYIIVSKKNYELKVYDEEGWYATYPIVFGSKDLGDKMREGDRRTPTGSFKVLQKKTNKKWGLELLLDYPTAKSLKDLKNAKQKA